MRELVGLASLIIISATWLAGIVIAKGFWSTLFAICVPFYSWYLVVERVMQSFNLI